MTLLSPACMCRTTVPITAYWDLLEGPPKAALEEEGWQQDDKEGWIPLAHLPWTGKRKETKETFVDPLQVFI